MPDQTPIIRPTARLLAIDPLGRVLLFKVDSSAIFDPSDSRGRQQPRIVWVLPGGGVEDGETFEAAARRELFEEAGIDRAVTGRPIFERDILLEHHGRPILFRERYFAVHVDNVDVSIDGQSELELADYRDHRWWSYDELTTTTDTFFPEGLPELLERAIADRFDAPLLTQPPEG